MSSQGFLCSLCLQFTSDSDDKDWFVSTPCGHIFHYSCIKGIIQNGHRSCPMCRDTLTLSNLTRLYGIDPLALKKQKKSSQDQDNTVDSFTDDYSLSMRKPDYTFKLVLLGNSGVGKSCLLKRFSTGVFHCDMTATTGCDMCFKTIEMGEKIVKLNIWDTAGQETFKSVTHNFVRNANGIMLVYDVTQPDSFEAIPEWLDFADKAGLPNAVKILAGNKIDEPRVVTTDQGKELATSLGISFFETSAKDCNNVEAAFRCLVGEIMEYLIMNTREFDDGNATPTISSCRLHLPNGRSCDDYYYGHGSNNDNDSSCIC